MSNRIEAIVTFLACSREGIGLQPIAFTGHIPAGRSSISLPSWAQRRLSPEPDWVPNRAQKDFEADAGQSSGFCGRYTCPRIFRSISWRQDREPHRNPTVSAYLAFTIRDDRQAEVRQCTQANTLLANARDLFATGTWTVVAVILSLSPLSHHIRMGGYFPSGLSVADRW